MNIEVSVVVPTCNRPHLLDRCLLALRAQDFGPQAYEILVVDDGPSNETYQLVQQHARLAAQNAPGPCIRYLCAKGTQGPAAARNVGWRAARGKIIAFTDDDCVPTPTWLRAGTLPFSHNGHVGVMGRLVVPIPPKPSDYQLNVAQMQHSAFLTANCFYRRDALEAVGGFDERFGHAWREDSDLLFTLIERYEQPEHHFSSTPEAIVYHPPREAPWGVSLKQQRKSLYNALLYKKHPRLYRELIQPAPPWRYYATLASGLSAIAAAGVGWRRMRFIATFLWLFLTVRFCLHRLQHTSHAPAHVAEMVVTSVLIPPLSIFWRLLGAIKYRVFFL